MRVLTNFNMNLNLYWRRQSIDVAPELIQIRSKTLLIYTYFKHIKCTKIVYFDLKKEFVGLLCLIFFLESTVRVKHPIYEGGAQVE